MVVYWDIAILLNFLVDFLLLIGTNRLSGFPPGAAKAAAAAGLGALYAGMCLLPEFRFLGNLLWRIVFLGLMSVIAFGCNKSAVQRGVLFIFLSMALGGIALGIGKGGFWGLIASAAGVCVLCVVGFQGKAGGMHYVPVELNFRDKRLHILGLQDTGNTLRDPVTGQQVLVAGAAVAAELMGLTQEQLRNPVETMGSTNLPGLRLIPYRSIGRDGGLLLGIRLPCVKIGTWQGSSVVAFSPDGFGKEDAYLVLTGGVV